MLRLALALEVGFDLGVEDARFVEGGARLGGLAQFPQHDSLVVPRIGVAGLGRQSPVITSQGFDQAVLLSLCVSRYENTGDVQYRDLILEVADLYGDALPGDKPGGDPGEEIDAWPGTFGHAIQVQLAAFRITADKRYFDRAFELGTTAIARFFGDSPLPRASLKADHYESTTGSDTLVLSFVDLHLTTRTITAVRAPVNTLDR